jgi:acetolactate synthase I/II/III large subunit
MARTGAQLLVEGLEAAGVEVVFGLPGVHNLPAWEALRESPIRLVGVRHEQAAVYAADGYARATGRLGVALVTTGPGAANTLGACGEAWASRSPVLVVATDIPTGLRMRGVHRGVLHECVDQPAMFAPVTKQTFAPQTFAELALMAFLAPEAAPAAPARPVYLEIPTDLLAGPATVGPVNRNSSGSGGAGVSGGASAWGAACARGGASACAPQAPGR